MATPSGPNKLPNNKAKVKKPASKKGAKRGDGRRRTNTLKKKDATPAQKRAHRVAKGTAKPRKKGGAR